VMRCGHGLVEPGRDDGAHLAESTPRRGVCRTCEGRHVYSAGLSCASCFSAYDAVARTEDELYGLFCSYCGSALTVVPVEPLRIDDELGLESVRLHVVQGPAVLR
jgi:hypothetical protein